MALNWQFHIAYFNSFGKISGRGASWSLFVKGEMSLVLMAEQWLTETVCKFTSWKKTKVCKCSEKSMY